MENIGMDLKVKRIQRGQRQSDVSEETGVPQCVISRIENGKIDGNQEAAKILQNYFTRKRSKTDGKNQKA